MIWCIVQQIFCFWYSIDIFSDFSQAISLSNAILPAPLSTVSDLSCGKVLETFVILSTILLITKSPAAFAVFLNYSFWRNSKCIRGGLFSVIKNLLNALSFLLLKFPLIFLRICLLIPCIYSKCYPFSYFIYIYSYCRITSHCLMLFDDILDIILNIWYRIWFIR